MMVSGGFAARPMASGGLSRAFVCWCALSLAPGNALLMAEEVLAGPPQDASSTQPAGPAAAPLAPQQIDSLVAPIALYPDELVSQVLVASTYPLEIVQAYQWMQQHPGLKGKDLTTAAQQQSWDPSIQALVAFPDVIKRMNKDVTWTTNLGNAFLEDQAGVMDEIQKLRSKAEAAGKLKSTEQQKVVSTTDNGQPVVEIVPASPGVIYVPDYDPAWIWGPAPASYPYPYWYYPAMPPLGLWCWWGGGIMMGSVFLGWNGWGGWGWHPGWHDHAIAMNHAFFAGNHFHDAHSINEHGGTVWAHDPGHRIGVAYPNRALAAHFNQPARSQPVHAAAGQAREQLKQSAARVQTERIGGRPQPAPAAAGPAGKQLSRPAARVQTERIGGRQIRSGGSGRTRTAFGGAEAGAAAKTHSNRGNSSLSHARPRGGGQRRRGGLR